MGLLFLRFSLILSFLLNCYLAQLSRLSCPKENIEVSCFRGHKSRKPPIPKENIVHRMKVYNPELEGRRQY